MNELVRCKIIIRLGFLLVVCGLVPFFSTFFSRKVERDEKGQKKNSIFFTARAVCAVN